MNDFPAQRQLIAALLDPDRSPLGAGKARLIETHISWVLLAGRHAYKIKKAVNLAFLDFTSLESRRFYCAEEVRINRRMAPQLYLDVIPIGGSHAKPVLGAQPAIEYAVKMHRFASANLLDRLLAKGKVTPRHMDDLAATLARFHRGLPPAAADCPYGAPASIRLAAMQNFEQMQTLLTAREDLDALLAARRLAEAEYAQLEQDFAARRTHGFVRECHGDLHLGNVALISGEPTPFDSIEFSAELRWCDVMSEAAFPVMDLLRYQQPALAFRLLNAYLEAGGDYAGISTLRFYLSYRAMVRAKICAIRASQTGLALRRQREELAACRGYLALAQHCLARRRPALIITHGLPGSGKTTFAQIALERFGAIRIRSDVERKRLFGLAPLEKSTANADIYSKDATWRTYARLEQLARGIVAAGFPVIVDAAFLKHSERDRFRTIAQDLNVPFAIAAIRAPDAVMRARVAQRRAGAADASEADENVLKRLQGAEETLRHDEITRSAEFVNDGANGGLDAQQGWAKLEAMLGGH